MYIVGLYEPCASDPYLDFDEFTSLADEMGHIATSFLFLLCFYLSYCGQNDRCVDYDDCRLAVIIQAKSGSENYSDAWVLPYT